MNTYMNTSKNIVLSDVDGTIVRGSLVLNHACDLHDKGIVDFGDAVEQWRSDPKNEHNITRLAEMYRVGIAGKNIHDLDVDGYIENIVSNDSNFYSTLNRLIDYRDADHRVVLISGSPHFLVGAFANHFGFDYAASQYHHEDGYFTGDCDGMFSAKAKRAYLENFGLDKYSNIVAFGDTCSDEPLFDSAHYSVLVEPNTYTRDALGHLVDEMVFD